LPKPLISILINNYNYEEFLREAIDSALAQEYPHVEVVVVDDGSTDNSRKIIASYGDRLVALCKENGGQASAFNAGYRSSRGEIICFLDADDIFTRDKARVMAASFECYPQAGWIFHRMDYIAKEGGLLKEFKTTETQLIDERLSMIAKGKLRYHAPATSALCFKREVLQHILPMPESIRFTSDNYIKFASLLLSPGVYLNQNLAYQRIHSRNIYTNRADLRLKAAIHCEIAASLVPHFPQAKKFAANLLAAGLADLLVEGAVNKETLKKQLEAFPPLERLYIKSRGFIKASLKKVRLLKGKEVVR
jgi:glycosyltransferase involved in cell wall biosynthesis